MALTLSVADAALKEFYEPQMVDQINRDMAFLQQIESTSKNVEGRRVVLSLHLTRNIGVGARAEGGTLPVAGAQGYAEERVGLKYNYGRIQLNGPVIRAMKSDEGSFVRAIESETRGIVTDLQEDVSRQIFNDSTQSVAQCGTTSSDNEIVLASDTTINQMNQFEIGHLVDVGTAGTPNSLIDGEAITAIDKSAKTITVTTSVTTSTSNYVTRKDNSGNELTGLPQIIDSTGTLFNVNPTTYPRWASYEAGSVSSIAESDWTTAIDTIHIESGRSPDLIVTTHGVVRAWAGTFSTARQYNDTVELNGGFRVTTVSAGSVTLPLLAERFVPPGEAYIVNTEHVKQHQSSEWEFMDEDGAVLNRVSNVDAYEATLFKYHELCTDRRNVHGKLTGITEA